MSAPPHRRPRSRQPVLGDPRCAYRKPERIAAGQGPGAPANGLACAALTSSSVVTPFFILCALSASYLLSPLVPFWVGWENGGVENLQVLLLCAAGLLAIRYGRRAQARQQRALWFLAAPIWFVLAARELSWGACFLLPFEMWPDTGPKFSSTIQLGYRPAIPPVVALLCEPAPMRPC